MKKNLQQSRRPTSATNLGEAGGVYFSRTARPCQFGRRKRLGGQALAELAVPGQELNAVIAC
ncbi:MAG: hypothetical protein ACKV0T_08105 [Planctomycetales bacterium]